MCNKKLSIYLFSHDLKTPTSASDYDGQDLNEEDVDRRRKPPQHSIVKGSEKCTPTFYEKQGQVSADTQSIRRICLVK